MGARRIAESSRNRRGQKRDGKSEAIGGDWR